MRLKIEAARRQLGTALYLFMEDMDPVSVQCLAGGGGEVMEFYALKLHGNSFMNVIVQTHPEHDEKKLRRARNEFWNAFKHAGFHGGQVERDDENLLARFDEEMNIHALMMGWTDYANASGHMPIEAQVFQVWAYARQPPKSARSRARDACCGMFPGLDKVGMAEQKRRLKTKIAEMRGEWALMGNPKTDVRGLVLPWREEAHNPASLLSRVESLKG